MTRNRFRPSANGYLHLGGAFTAGACRASALAKGGEFVLIVDDIVPRFKWGDTHPDLPAEMVAYRDAFVRDLEWLGWGPDIVHLASEFHDAHVAAAATLGLYCRGFGEVQHIDRYVRNCDQTWTPAQYDPWLTVGRVTDDHEAGVTEFVRGGDLVTECQLYDYFATRLYGDAHRVLQSYGPIIIDPQDAICSKSGGSASIAEYREAGVTAEQIREALLWANLDELTEQYGQLQHRYLRVRAELVTPAKPQRRAAR